MASKRNVKFIQPEVPSFVKKFKERVGYKEPVDISDKFSDSVENSEGSIPVENDERQVEREEQPVIVVVREGDLTAEEVEEHKKENSSTDCWDTESDKPVFKKPVKRTSTEKEMNKKKKRKSDVKPVKNSKLLSFDEDEEES